MGGYFFVCLLIIFSYCHVRKYRTAFLRNHIKFLYGISGTGIRPAKNSPQTKHLTHRKSHAPLAGCYGSSYSPSTDYSSTGITVPSLSTNTSLSGNTVICSTVRTNSCSSNTTSCSAFFSSHINASSFLFRNSLSASFSLIRFCLRCTASGNDGQAELNRLFSFLTGKAE